MGRADARLSHAPFTCVGPSVQPLHRAVFSMATIKENIISSFTSFPSCLATYFVLAGIAGLLFFSWKPALMPIPTHVVDDPLAHAQAKAIELNGRVHVVSPTGSMKPALQAGDYAVSVKEPFSSLVVGKVLVYKASFRDKSSNSLVHRVAMIDQYGLIMSGDSNNRTESFARVTPDNYEGTIVDIYRK